MPKTNIDLGHGMGKPEMPSMPDKMYPTVHIESDKEIDFPKEGQMTVKFKKIRSEHSEGENGPRYSCTLELHKIVELYGSEKEAPYKRDKSAEESLDALAAKRMKEKEEDNDEYED